MQREDRALRAALPAQSPLYQPPRPSMDGGGEQDQSYVGRLQPPLGFGGGTYVLNTAVDAGTPAGVPAEVLPGLRSGAYSFSQRLRAQGDQGAIDPLLRSGGSYLAVRQAPYWTDDRPAGR